MIGSFLRSQAKLRLERTLPLGFVGWLLLAALGLVLGCASPSKVSEPNGPTFTDFEEATIAEMQKAMESGLITSRQLTSDYLARIEAYDQQGPRLNSLSAVNPNALEEAEWMDAERAASGPRGPLHGIPVIVKDNYLTRGLQTAAGSASLAGWVSQEDATVVRRLRDAGAVLLAKSNMHEFAYGLETIGSLFGQTRNPYDPARNAGGSSGGTGAAVAASFAAVGLGSDTCGSIRIPSAFNNLVGIRGTQGLVSRAGIVPLSSTQDIGGPLARSTYDLAIVLDAISGPDPLDAQTSESASHVPPTYTRFLREEALAGARIGVLNELFEGDRSVSEVVRRALDLMASEGAEVVAAEVPDLAELLDDPMGGFLVLIHDFKFDLDDFLASHQPAPASSLAEIIASGKVSNAEQVLPRLEESQAIQSRETEEYQTEIDRREVLRNAIVEVMDDLSLDAVAYPTIGYEPALLGEGQEEDSACHLAAKSGMPALSMPAGFTEAGLPVGLELLGRPWAEGRLIELAHSFERAVNRRRSPQSTPPLR